MAVADNHFSIFQDADVLQEQYWAEYLEQTVANEIGQDENRLFRTMESGEFEVSGDGVTFQTEIYAVDAARGDTNMLSAFPTPRSFVSDKIKFRFHPSDSSSNDFFRISLSAKTHEFEKVNDGEGAAVSVAKRAFMQMMPDYERKLAMFRALPRSGRICLVNGTPKKNDDTTYADASSTATNAAGVRFKVDNGAIAMLQPGTRIDVYRAGVPIAQKLRVSDYNPEEDDGSVGLDFISTGDDTSDGDVANILDNDELYLSNGYGLGMYGHEAWFENPTASETWIGGVDRTDTDKRWLEPVKVRKGSSTVEQLSASHFYNLHTTMKMRGASNGRKVIVASPRLIDRMATGILENNNITMTPPSADQARDALFGYNSVFWMSPSFGKVELMPSLFIRPDVVRLFTPSTWRRGYYGVKGLKRMPGDGGSHWYRENGDDPSGGKSLFYRTDAYAVTGDVCLKPYENGEIQNVKA